jgi:predicted protein tyrosine phosphatase
MEIRIAGYVPASFLLEREPNQWHALVVLDSGKQATTFVREHARSHLFLHFDDIEQPHGAKQAPTSLLIEQALAFVKGKDKLLVSCRAGQGRSVAMAYLACCQERSVAEALTLLDPTRHRPNRLVISLGDALLGQPDVLDHFDDWRRGNAHVRLSDYYDRLEKELDDLEAQGARDRITGG